MASCSRKKLQRPSMEVRRTATPRPRGMLAIRPRPQRRLQQILRRQSSFQHFLQPSTRVCLSFTREERRSRFGLELRSSWIQMERCSARHLRLAFVGCQSFQTERKEHMKPQAARRLRAALGIGEGEHCETSCPQQAPGSTGYWCCIDRPEHRLRTGTAAWAIQLYAGRHHRVI
jgi:hypothetical protein